MRIQILVWVVVVSLAVVVSGLAIHLFSQQSTLVLGSPSPSAIEVEVSPGPSPVSTAIASPSVSPEASPIVSASAYYYPMTRYAERISNRSYGDSITAADRQPLRCGYPFEGFHTGDDLEVFPDELGQSVPVYAIADGTVRQLGAVAGYGGLLVIEHRLNGQTASVYYGHINLDATTVQEGQRVRAGQQVTVLGDDCSPQSGNERKHLHFAIRRGSAVDVRGYVSAESALTSWLNPQALLEELAAQMPSS